jgi:hypothetical protein
VGAASIICDGPGLGEDRWVTTRVSIVIDYPCAMLDFAHRDRVCMQVSHTHDAGRRKGKI